MLPKKLQDIMDGPELVDLFPMDFDIDRIDKDHLWQCIPIIPSFDIERIEEKLKF